jgi:hypothetical protein
MTALHYLAEKGDANVMEALIEANADMNLLDSVSLLLAFVLPWMTYGVIKLTGSSNLMCVIQYVQVACDHCPRIVLTLLS